MTDHPLKPTSEFLSTFREINDCATTAEDAVFMIVEYTRLQCRYSNSDEYGRAMDNMAHAFVAYACLVHDKTDIIRNTIIEECAAIVNDLTLPREVALERIRALKGRK